MAHRPHGMLQRALRPSSKRNYPVLPSLNEDAAFEGPDANGSIAQPDRRDLERLLVGGLANPLQVIEQITYLIFIKRLDEMQELEARKATTLGRPVERRIFPEGATFDESFQSIVGANPASPGVRQ